MYNIISQTDHVYMTYNSVGNEDTFKSYINESTCSNLLSMHPAKQHSYYSLFPYISLSVSLLMYASYVFIYILSCQYMYRVFPMYHNKIFNYNK